MTVFSISSCFGQILTASVWSHAEILPLLVSFFVPLGAAGESQTSIARRGKNQSHAERSMASSRNNGASAEHAIVSVDLELEQSGGDVRDGKCTRG